jgi:hypothetical protein
MVGMTTNTQVVTPKWKRGYENGEQAIEIYEGKVDVVLYNDKPDKPSFYFYRFDPEMVFGQNSDLAMDIKSNNVSYVHRQEVESFLSRNGLDYNTMLTRLLNTAWSLDMRMRDEM